MVEVPIHAKRLFSPLDENSMGSVSSDFVSNSQVHAYSVSEINRIVKKKLESRDLQKIWIRGEISNFKAHPSGHHYFSLKDQRTQIGGVMFKSYNSFLRFQPENGMEVLVHGKVTVYEPRGIYQFFCENMEPVGTGALQQAFEQLKKKLNARGFFDEEKKQSLPLYPKEVAVVTSPTGAAIQDILKVLARRSKRVQVTVIPTRVQGEEAAGEIVKAIELANRVDRFGVILLGRGGGSMEDLWCFNEEKVAKAIHASRIPIVSAVGHEIDFTISDFVADYRAPTPSAAAEIITQSEQELMEKLASYNKLLRKACYQRVENYRKQMKLLEKSLVSPERFLRDSRLRLDDCLQRLSQTVLRSIQDRVLQVRLKQQTFKDPCMMIRQDREKVVYLGNRLFLLMKQKMDFLKNNFQKQAHLLASLNPLGVLDRGYGIVRVDGHLLQSVKELKTDRMEVELKDGFLDAKVLKIRKKEGS